MAEQIEQIEQIEQNAVTEEFCYNGESYEDLLKEVLSDLNFSVKKLVFMYFLKFKENIPDDYDSSQREDLIKRNVQGFLGHHARLLYKLRSSDSNDTLEEWIINNSVQRCILEPFKEIYERILADRRKEEEFVSLGEYNEVEKNLKDSNSKQILMYGLEASSELFPEVCFPLKEEIMELLDRIKS